VIENGFDTPEAATCENRRILCGRDGQLTTNRWRGQWGSSRDVGVAGKPRCDKEDSKGNDEHGSEIGQRTIHFVPVTVPIIPEK
jgi:hypothetical protein